MPSGEFAERIFRFIQARGYEPQQIRQLAETMGVGEGELGDFHQACKALMRSGRIIMGAKSAVTLPDPGGRIVGSFRANPRGFGFVIPDAPNSHGDLYVPPGSTGGALTGDTVSARVKKRGKRDGRMMYEGKIEEIIRRGQSRFVGQSGARKTADVGNPSRCAPRTSPSAAFRSRRPITMPVNITSKC